MIIMMSVMVIICCHHIMIITRGTMNEQYYRHIKSALALRGITISAIARKIGVSQPCVTQTMQGKIKSPKTRVAIAEALGQPVRNLFPSEEQSKGGK